MVLFLAILLLGSATGCAKKRRAAAVQSFATTSESYYDGAMALEKRNLRKAKSTFERMAYQAAEDRRVYEPLARIGIADSTYYLGDTLSLIDARSLYLDFVTIYGDHPLAAYAQLQAGICSLKQVNHPSRDQSQTLMAIRDLVEVERRYPTSAYSRVARQKVNEATGNLAEHEFLVGKFYAKKKRWEAAASRLRGILQRYPEFHEMDKVYFYLGKALLKQENSVEGLLYLDKLRQDYPDSKYAKPAANLVTATESQ